jgi:hypothetical protein
MSLVLYFLFSGLLASRQVPAGTRLNIRLTTTVGSYASKAETPIQALLIAPVIVNGETLLPAGSTLSGKVKSVRRVGLGIRHETAALDLEFSQVTVPNGDTLPMSARVEEVDNGRERVSRDGEIRGVRTTSSLCYRASGYIRTVLLWYIHAELAEWVIRSLIVEVPEPEIYYPAGVELTLTLYEPLLSTAPLDSGRSGERFTDDERDDLASLVAAMPYRSYAAASDLPSDLVNILFIGSRDELAASFVAAGWAEAHATSFRSGFQIIRGVAEGHGYRFMPMSALLVNETGADMSWEKVLNDVAKRHHIRIWKQPETWRGRELWIGAATRDVNFAYMRGGKPLTHRVEVNIDQERDKIANDLIFTSCVDLVDWMPRPGAPRMARNATGDLMNTDARLAVISLNNCNAPRLSTETVDPAPVPARGGQLQRFARREILSARSDLLRTNMYWRSYEVSRWLVGCIRRHRASRFEREVLRTIPPSNSRSSQVAAAEHSHRKPAAGPGSI